MSRRRADAALGFTMVEVLVGLFLLAGITLGIMAFIDTSMHLNKLALERSIATGLAAERLEAVLSERFHGEALLDIDDSLYGLPGEVYSEETSSDPDVRPDGDYHVYTAAPGTIPGYEDYERQTWLIYDEPFAPMMRAEVSVRWFNLHQKDWKTHTMVTYLHPDIERTQ